MVEFSIHIDETEIMELWNILNNVENKLSIQYFFDDLTDTYKEELARRIRETTKKLTIKKGLEHLASNYQEHANIEDMELIYVFNFDGSFDNCFFEIIDVFKQNPDCRKPHAVLALNPDSEFNEKDIKLEIEEEINFYIEWYL